MEVGAFGTPRKERHQK